MIHCIFPAECTRCSGSAKKVAGGAQCGGQHELAVVSNRYFGPTFLSTSAKSPRLLALLTLLALLGHFKHLFSLRELWDALMDTSALLGHFECLFLLLLQDSLLCTLP